VPDRAACATFFKEQQMNAFTTIRSMSTATAIAALALASGVAFSGENQPFGRSSVYPTAAPSSAPASSAFAATRGGRSSVYAADERDGSREVNIASRMPGFEGNGRGSVYAWQIRQQRDGVASLDR
jgi:hypothetical protein